MRSGTAKVDHSIGLHVADVPTDLAVPASAADFKEEEVLLVAASAVVIDGVGIEVDCSRLRATVAREVAVTV